jgi:hypothetical protein
MRRGAYPRIRSMSAWPAVPDLSGRIQNPWYRGRYRDGISVPDLGGIVMRLSSSIVASSALVVLSTALLSGPAVSQTASGSTTALPNITVEAPKPVATPHRPTQTATAGASHRIRSAGHAASSTAQTSAAASGSVLGRIAKLERSASSCNGGCETSYRTGNAPWVGCSYSGAESSVGVFSATCRDTLTYRTYAECTSTKIFLGWIAREARWHCSSLLAAGKLAGENQRQVAELKQSGHR